jgi:hypothetical protein
MRAVKIIISQFFFLSLSRHLLDYSITLSRFTSELQRLTRIKNDFYRPSLILGQAYNLLCDDEDFRLLQSPPEIGSNLLEPRENRLEGSNEESDMRDGTK